MNARVLAVLLLAWSAAASAGVLDPALATAAGMHAYPVPLKAPAFQLPDLEGAIRAKAGYRGRVVLLNFWASWCPPCREEFPSLERLQKRMGAKGFTVVAVTVSDDPQGVSRFLGGRTVPFDVLIDTTDRTASAYRANGVPVTYLLDRQGRMIAGKSGPHVWDDPAVVELIRAALNSEEGN